MSGGSRASALPLDITKADSVNAGVAKCAAEYGRIDILREHPGSERSQAPARVYGRRVGPSGGHQPQRKLSASQKPWRRDGKKAGALFLRRPFDRFW